MTSTMQSMLIRALVLVILVIPATGLQGAAFSVKGFNNRFLSYGNAPVRLIRELMIASP